MPAKKSVRRAAAKSRRTTSDKAPAHSAARSAPKSVTQQRAWKALAAHHKRIKRVTLKALFAKDAARGHVRGSATLADYGVTPEDVNAAMAPYIARYGAQLKQTERA